MAHGSWRARLAAGWCLLVVAVGVGSFLRAGAGGSRIWVVVVIAFVGSGTFIVRHHPRNPVGWLLLLPGVAAFDALGQPVLRAVAAGGPSGRIGPGLLAALWLSNFAWVFVFLPTILVLALFPTGRPVTPAWRWHARSVGVMGGVLLIGGTFAETIGPLEAEWVVANPIGFLPPVDAWPGFMFVWSAGLVAVTLGSLASMALRRQRAGPVERVQLTWLLYAVSLFAVVYVPVVVLGGEVRNWVLDVAFVGAVLFIPVAIGMAIVRHNVLDIVVVVRRTVVYVLLIGVLVAVYVGSVLVLQSITRGVTGADGSVGVALSTLLVAGLFNPLRSRVHRLAARRFFRTGYDPELVTATFGRAVRDPTDLERVGLLLREAAVGALRPSHSRLVLIGRMDSSGGGG